MEVRDMKTGVTRAWAHGSIFMVVIVLVAAVRISGGVARRVANEAPADAGPPGCAEGIGAGLDRLVTDLMAIHRVPGVSLTVIEGRRILLDRSYGIRRAGRPEKVHRDTVFEACSMSKPPVAYLALKLVEQGELDLDRPLRAYIDKPYLPDEPLHERITARMVLSHTSGFPNWRDGGWRKGGALPVLFEPGTRFGYSGEGFLYLQRVMARITGLPLEQHIKKVLFGPVGMSFSSYVWEDGYEKRAAAGHDHEGEVKTDRPRFRQANAGYSLFCTSHEYARFLLEILKEDRSAEHSLCASSIDAMLTRTTKATYRKPIQRSGKPLSDAVYWGLGWAIDKTAAGDRIYHSGANGTGFRCYSEFDPKRGTGLVIMTNGMGGDKLWQGVVAAVGAP